MKIENGCECGGEHAGCDLPLIERIVFFKVKVGESKNQRDNEEGGQIEGPFRHAVRGIVVFSVFHYHLATKGY